MTRTLTTIPPGPRSAAPPGPAASRVRRAAAEVSPATIEQIARRVAELLNDRAASGAQPTGLVDAGTVARHFGLTRGWVYQHAAELGAIRIGDGPKARLRFDLPGVAAALAAPDGEDAPAKAPSSRPPARRHPRDPRFTPGSDVSLLPISPLTRVRGLAARLNATPRRTT